MENATNTAGNFSNFYNSVDKIRKSETASNECNLPLGWHKFLIYFALWAAAIVNLISGFVIMGFAFRYANYTSYGVGGMLLYGLCCFVMGIFAIVVRSELANFSAGAPKHLITMQVISLVAPIAINLLTGVGLGSSWLVIVGSIVCICINSVYYNNRAAMFTRG